MFFLKKYELQQNPKLSFLVKNSFHIYCGEFLIKKYIHLRLQWREQLYYSHGFYLSRYFLLFVMCF